MTKPHLTLKKPKKPSLDMETTDVWDIRGQSHRRTFNNETFNNAWCKIEKWF